MKVICKTVLFGLGVGLWGIGMVPALAGTNLVEPNVYAYAANAGWVNAAGDTTNGMVVGENYCSGFIYGANFGWVDMGDGSPVNGVNYSNANGVDFGVNVETDGRLRGFAYGANIGWINFEEMGNPRVNLISGVLSGHAYSANMGWISLKHGEGFVQTDSLEPGPDSDGDTIPDAWELTGTDDLAVLTKTGDVDGDGADDFSEYLGGTDPFDSDSVLSITQIVLDQVGSNADITWNSVTGRLYRVELNEALAGAAFADSTQGDFTPDSGLSTTATVPMLDPDKIAFRVKAIRPLAP